MVTLFLQDHGTKAFSLPPSAVVSAAQADIALAAAKAESDEAIKNRQYAFHREHVRRAKDAADLLKRALADLPRGVGSSKPNTRMLYSSPKLLRAALEFASRSG